MSQGLEARSNMSGNGWPNARKGTPCTSKCYGEAEMFDRVLEQ